MPKQKGFETPNELGTKGVERKPVKVDKAETATEGSEELAEINDALAFGKQTEGFLKKHPGILNKVGETAEKIMPTNTVRKYWDKLPKEAQMALIYSDLGTNAALPTALIAGPLRFLRKVGIIDNKGDETESDRDKKTSIQKGIEWLAKHYPETAVAESGKSGARTARNAPRKSRLQTPRKSKR